MDEGTRLQQWLHTLGFEGDEEMEATGRRFAEFLREFVPAQAAPEVSTCASRPGSGEVQIREIPFYSLCAHHLLPFFGTVSVAYRPGARLAGLGAVPRLVEHFARRPQLQERLTDQIADALVEALDPVGVVVHCRARHLCVEMRGAPNPVEVRTVARRGHTDDMLRTEQL